MADGEGKGGDWRTEGRDGAGLKEEYGEEWCMMLVEDGGAPTAMDASHRIVHAPHPKGNGNATYIMAGERILEVRAACRSGAYSCWFVGDYCQKDGSIIFATHMDPLFLALPSLEAARKKTEEHAGRFTPRDQTIQHEEDDQGVFAALKSANLDLEAVCDVKDVGGDLYFRLSDDKVVAWLRSKVAALIAYKYPGCDDSVPEGGWTVVKIDESGVEDKIHSLEAAGMARAAKERHVFGISLVGQYVSDVWVDRLLASYSLNKKDLEPMRVSSKVGDEQFKTFSTGKSKDEKDKLATAKKPKAAASKLANVNTKGMSSMMAFFKPKEKA